VELRSQLPSLLCQALDSTALPPRNTPAAREEQAGRKVLRASFCGAAGARASICACTAFNTDLSVDQSAKPSDEPRATAPLSIDVVRNRVRVQRYNVSMSEAIPAEIHDQKYISLTTFRKNGAKVATPVWFGEDGAKLYVMTLSKMGKTKRIRNNPQVTVAPCTMRGKVTGPEVAALARILPSEEHAHARQTVNRKYLLARLSSPWSKADAFLEISFP
jgi:PPOX class probable F420-dependent enzyme